MNRHFRKAADTADAAPCNAAWSFAQALLGKPVPSVSAAEPEARRKSEHLEWLAQISPEHERQFRRESQKEADAHAQRRQLEWLASISPEHEAKLRRLQIAEARAMAARAVEARVREELARSHWLVEGSQSQIAEWDAAKHPRGGYPQNRGWWSPSSGGGGSGERDTLDRAAGARKSTSANNSTSVNPDNAPPEMVALADAWRQTNELLQQYRRDIEALPKSIANIQSKRDSRGNLIYTHPKYVASIQRRLEIAKASAPQLEAQLRELEEKYHELGYDDVAYTTWTPGETLISGRGIAKVGDAIHNGGTPAGLRPTGDEELVATTAAGVFRLGQWALKKAIGKASSSAAREAATLKPYGGVGGGHHVVAKSALKGAPGYDANAALAIPREELARLEVWHNAVTGAQQTLYREFAKAGERLTWDAVERIETEALVRGGLNADVARATVRQAIEALKKAGISGPTRIPWGK
jgi:hypothetical protein